METKECETTANEFKYFEFDFREVNYRKGYLKIQTELLNDLDRFSDGSFNEYDMLNDIVPMYESIIHHSDMYADENIFDGDVKEIPEDDCEERPIEINLNCSPEEFIKKIKDSSMHHYAKYKLYKMG